MATPDQEQRKSDLAWEIRDLKTQIAERTLTLGEVAQSRAELEFELEEKNKELQALNGALTEVVPPQKKESHMALVTAKVAGGSAQSVSDVASIADVRAKLGLASNYAASINGEPADDSESLEDGAFVTFAPQVKGAK